MPGLIAYVSASSMIRVGNNCDVSMESLASIGRCGSMLRGSLAPAWTVIAFCAEALVGAGAEALVGAGAGALVGAAGCAGALVGAADCAGAVAAAVGGCWGAATPPHPANASASPSKGMKK